ncbi:MAG: hypothetical protein AB1609_11595 [Bacillota bacterium]
MTWGRVEETPEGQEIEVFGPAPFPRPGCGGEMGRVTGASVPTYWCSRCRIAVLQPDEETAREIDQAAAAGDEDFHTVGELVADEAAVKAWMARLRGGHKSGRRKRRERRPARPVAPLVTAEEDEKAAAEARRRIAEWEAKRRQAV